jgi:hypothetical protein
MKLYSYVVARDYGFAPNPFHGVCTLATCKPKIRHTASVGDWILGTGSKGYGLEGRLVFAMEVRERLAFDEYWNDDRFQSKKPNMRGSVKQAYGDNIYHRDKNGKWIQANSHHSNPDGTPNHNNISHDTQSPIVLVGTRFAYWGGAGVPIPARFRKPALNLCAQRGHKSNFPADFAKDVVTWIESLKCQGYLSLPAELSQ